MIFRGIHRLTSRAPAVVGVFFAVLSAGALLLASKLKFEGDVTALLPAKDTALYREVVDRVGGQAELLLLLEGDDPQALLAAAAKYKEALSAHPNVISVEYEPKIEGPLSEDLAPLLERETMTDRMKRVREKLKSGLLDPLLREDPLGVREAVALDAKARFSGYRFDLSAGGLFSEDRKALLVIVSGREKPLNLPAARSTVEAARSVRVPVQVSMTGGYLVAVESEKQVRGDLLGTSAFSLVGVLLLFLIGFREPRSLLFASVPVLVGVVLTAGLAQVIYGRLTPISVVFGAMVVGIGIDFPIQFYNRWRAEGDIARTLTGIGPSLLSGALTTSAVLWALLPSRLPVYRELGVLGGTGIFLTLAATLFLCPLLVPARRKIVQYRVPLLRISRTAFPLCLLLTLVFALFASQGVSFEEDYLKMAGAEDVFRTQEHVMEKFGGSLDSVFFVSRSPEEAKRLEPKLKALVPRGIFSGVLPAQRPLQRADFREDFRQAVIDAGFKPTAYQDYEDWIAHRLNAPAKPLLVSVGMLRERLNQRNLRRATLAAIRETGAEFTGGAALTDALDQTYREDAKRATLLGAVAVLLLVAIHLRRPLRILLAVLPVAVGLVWTLGLMNLMDLRVDPLSVTVFLLVIGIGIDNGIHFVARTRQIGTEVASAELLLPMILTSTTTMLSFGTLVFASMGMLRVLGQVLVLGVGASLAAALFILPTVLAWWRR